MYSGFVSNFSDFLFCIKIGSFCIADLFAKIHILLIMLSKPSCASVDLLSSSTYLNFTREHIRYQGISKYEGFIKEQLYPHLKVGIANRISLLFLFHWLNFYCPSCLTFSRLAFAVSGHFLILSICIFTCGQMHAYMCIHIYYTGMYTSYILFLKVYVIYSYLQINNKPHIWSLS